MGRCLASTPPFINQAASKEFADVLQESLENADNE
jgi:hypothetical protein